jgi:hypothetical protein
LVGEESVSGVTAEPPPGQSGAPTHVRLYHRQRRDHAVRLPEGATVDEVASVTGWQRHTVRGVFSGTLKKRLGLTLTSVKEERGRVYRIAEPASL